MSSLHARPSDLLEENGRLRKAIAEAEQLLDVASVRLRKVLEDPVLIEATPLEVEAAMLSAVDAVRVASRGLRSLSRRRSAPKISGGPTPQQGQFLAYIRDYMLHNSCGVAPTHAELQRFFNLTPPSVNSMLKRLDEKNFIRRTPGKARAIELTIDPELIPPLDRTFKFR